MNKINSNGHLLVILDGSLVFLLLLGLELALKFTKLVIKIILINVDIVITVEHFVHVVTLVLEVGHLIANVIKFVEIEISHDLLLLLDYLLHRLTLSFLYRTTISSVFWMFYEVNATWLRVNWCDM